MALSAAIGVEQGLPGATGATGPAGNTFTTFAVFGTTGKTSFTGASGIGAGQGSGWMVYWNTGVIQPTGVIQWTSIGTAAGIIQFGQGGYYQIETDISPTGIPTLTTWYSQIRFGATGGANGGLGSGSGANVNLTVGNDLSTTNNAGLFFIPSGGNMEVYAYMGTVTGLNVSATGTSLTIFKII